MPRRRKSMEDNDMLNKIALVAICMLQTFVLVIAASVGIVIPIAIAAYLCNAVCALDPLECIFIAVSIICCIAFAFKSM